MAKTPGKKTANDRLELDKISLANIASGSARKPMTSEESVPGDTGQPTSPAPGNRLLDRKKSNQTLLVILAILALLMALAAIFKPQDFSLTLQPETVEPDVLLENYLRVGPITTTLANEDIVKFSIDIDCKNAKIKELLAGKDSQIRDRIITVLTDPDTEKLFAKRDFEAVKTKIKDRLGDLPVDDIYFSELLLY